MHVTLIIIIIVKKKTYNVFFKCTILIQVSMGHFLIRAKISLRAYVPKHRIGCSFSPCPMRVSTHKLNRGRAAVRAAFNPAFVFLSLDRGAARRNF